MAPTRTRGAHGNGDGDADGGSRSAGPGRPHGGAPPSVAAAQEVMWAKARQGRPRNGAGRAGSQASGGEAVPPRSAGPDSRSARSFVDNITADPTSVSGRSAEDLADQFNAAGYAATIERSRKKGTSGHAVQVRVQGHPEITNIQVHPGGGRHTPEGSPYWKISTSTAGKTWVVPEVFRGAEELGGKVVRYAG
jgi:hypothetical protein